MADQEYRFLVRGGNYRRMMLLWHITSWIFKRKCWDKVTGTDYLNNEIDTYYLIRLGRR